MNWTVQFELIDLKFELYVVHQHRLTLLLSFFFACLRAFSTGFINFLPIFTGRRYVVYFDRSLITIKLVASNQVEFEFRKSKINKFVFFFFVVGNSEVLNASRVRIESNAIRTRTCVWRHSSGWYPNKHFFSCKFVCFHSQPKSVYKHAFSIVWN